MSLYDSILMVKNVHFCLKKIILDVARFLGPVTIAGLLEEGLSLEMILRVFNSLKKVLSI